jgi:hypothetical protein
LAINDSLEIIEDECLYLGGIPLTIARFETYRGLCVVIADAAIEDPYNPFLTYSFIPFGIANTQFALKVENERRIIVAALDYANTDPDYVNPKELYAGGIPLTQNSDYAILAKDCTSISEADEEAELSLGGTPILARRYDYNWYLVVTE